MLNESIDGVNEMQDVAAQSAAAIRSCEAAAINPPSVYENTREADARESAYHAIKRELENIVDAFNDNDSLHGPAFLSPTFDGVAIRGADCEPKFELWFALEGRKDDCNWSRLADALDGLSIFAKAMATLDRARAGKVGV